MNDSIAAAEQVLQSSPHAHKPTSPDANGGATAAVSAAIAGLHLSPRSWADPGGAAAGGTAQSGQRSARLGPVGVSNGVSNSMALISPRSDVVCLMVCLCPMGWPSAVSNSMALMSPSCDVTTHARSLITPHMPDHVIGVGGVGAVVAVGGVALTSRCPHFSLCRPHFSQVHYSAGPGQGESVRASDAGGQRGAVAIHQRGGAAGG